MIQRLEIVLLLVGVPLAFATLVVRLLPARVGKGARGLAFAVSGLLCAGATLIVGVTLGLVQP